jgi:hypothetical protein
MLDFLKNLFGDNPVGVKFFEGIGAPMPNFSIVATQVRAGVKQPKNYLLTDAKKLDTIKENWRFEPSFEPISRCGYDYNIVLTNGEQVFTVDVCFLCNTLVVNHLQAFKTSKRQIQNLLESDFIPQ